MKAEESLALIAYRLERARESLRAAEIMFENNMLTFSMKGFILNIEEYLRQEDGRVW